MSKKIIAISLVLVIIVTCFVACGKKLETTIINGKEVALVTDENGDPIINDKNQVIALVTDEAGKVIEYSNGEDQTRYIDLADALEIKGVVYGDKYKMNVLEGWEAGRGSKICKKDTENKCYISFDNVKTNDDNETLASYLQKIDQQNEMFEEAFKQKGYNCSFTNSTDVISGDISCKVYVYKVQDSEGKVIHYAENYYFTVDEAIYSVNYACADGVGYDETFSFGDYLKTNFNYVD